MVSIIENNWISQDILDSYLSKMKDSHFVYHAIALKIARIFIVWDQGIVKGIAVIYPSDDKKLAVALSMDKHTLDKQTLIAGLKKIHEMMKFFSLEFEFSNERPGWERFISMKLGIK